MAFVQDWDQERTDNPDAPEWGDWEDMATYLAQWDMDAADIRDESPAGPYDTRRDFTVDGTLYTLTTNDGLRYAGLERAVTVADAIPFWDDWIIPEARA